MAGRVDLPQGTLELLMLRTIALEPQHGHAISERIWQVSTDVIKMPQGSLYPALHRLERRGLIRHSWGISDSGLDVRDSGTTVPLACYECGTEVRTLGILRAAS